MSDEKIEESYNEHKNTSSEVSKALITNNFDNSLNYAEIGIDSFITDDVLKEIPLVKTVVGVVKSGLKVKEILFTKKILTFLKEFHSGDLSKEKTQKPKDTNSTTKPKPQTGQSESPLKSLSVKNVKINNLNYASLKITTRKKKLLSLS